MTDDKHIGTIPAGLQYLIPSADYFWHWVEGGEVIACSHGYGDTICYRDDLCLLLKELLPDGLPRLGALLIILAAARGSWTKNSGLVLAIDRIIDTIRDKEPAAISPQIEKALEEINVWLANLASLPEKVRTGSRRAILIRTLFAGQQPALKERDAEHALFVLNSGRADDLLLDTKTPLIASHVLYDIISLHEIAVKYSNRQALELLLRTGVAEIPEVPAPVLQAGPAQQLLEILASDLQTAGIARLTQHIVAALNIPMHAHGASDQSFGGLSDISNRGNFDRLLLSELAYDDDTLLARLANNESLYLRREELPDDANRLRLLLVDTTIRMWGVPRLFAVAAALACTVNNKANAVVSAYTLNGHEARPADVGTRNGVVSMMEELHAHLGCEQVLASFMADLQTDSRREVFFFTDEATARSLHFQFTLANMPLQPDFIVTVNRSGHLQYYALLSGRRKLLSEAHLDINSLLHENTQSVSKMIDDGSLPSFLRQLELPLFLPSANVKLSRKNAYSPAVNQAVVVTYDKRVLYFKNAAQGARELLSRIEKGWHYFFGSPPEGHALAVYILVTGIAGQKPRMYTIDLESYDVSVCDIDEIFNQASDAVFDNGRFLVNMNGRFYKLFTDGRFTESGDSKNSFAERRERLAPGKWDLKQLRRIVTPGYSTLIRIENVAVHSKALIFNRSALTINGDDLVWIPMKAFEMQHQLPVWSCKQGHKLGLYHSLRYGSLQLLRFSWRDGSEVIADSRGLLHLKSADPNVPEITLVMVHEKPIACWSSDGQRCGAAYFAGNGARMSAKDFYSRYIQQFLDKIVHYENEA